MPGTRLFCMFVYDETYECRIIQVLFTLGFIGGFL